MINVSIYKNSDNMITGFKLSGHAKYARSGRDVVCAAASVLAANTVNSIEQFTSDRFTVDEDEKKGYLEFHVISEPSNYASLLLNSLALGLYGIEAEYTSKYISITQVESQ